MDIHKPKPWHGVREFLKEYAIIVVGVLTALGAEQIVEMLHWRHEVQAARESLKPEYLRLLEGVGRQDGEAACVARRLDELQDLLETAATSGRLPPLGNPMQPTRDAWRLRAWDSVVSGQVLPHMSRNEVLYVSGVAAAVDYLVQTRDDEMTQWATLETLMGTGRKIESNELSAYRRALGQAARSANIMRKNSDGLSKAIVDTGIVTRAEAVEVWRKGLEQGHAWRICKPMGTIPVRLSAAQPDLAGPPNMPF